MLRWRGRPGARHAAGGGEIVATSEVMAEIAADLPTLGLEVAPFATVPPGFEQPVQVSRPRLGDG